VILVLTLAEQGELGEVICGEGKAAWLAGDRRRERLPRVSRPLAVPEPQGFPLQTAHVIIPITDRDRDWHPKLVLLAKTEGVQLKGAMG
jgi:hypothetical protein